MDFKITPAWKESNTNKNSVKNRGRNRRTWRRQTCQKNAETHFRRWCNVAHTHTHIHQQGSHGYNVVAFQVKTYGICLLPLFLSLSIFVKVPFQMLSLFQFTAISVFFSSFSALSLSPLPLLHHHSPIHKHFV